MNNSCGYSYFAFGMSGRSRLLYKIHLPLSCAQYLFLILTEEAVYCHSCSSGWMGFNLTLKSQSSQIITMKMHENSNFNLAISQTSLFYASIANKSRNWMDLLNVFRRCKWIHLASVTSSSEDWSVSREEILIDCFI